MAQLPGAVVVVAGDAVVVVVGSVVVVGGEVVVGGDVVVGGEVVVGGDVVVGGAVGVGAAVVVDDCGTAGNPVNGGVVGLDVPDVVRRRATVVGVGGASVSASVLGTGAIVVVVVVVGSIGVNEWGTVMVNVVAEDESLRRALCGELLPALAADTPSGRRMAASMPTTIFCQRSIASVCRRGRARGLGAQQGEAQVPDRARQPEVAHVARDRPVLGA
jgi:hypothetical protein